MIIGYARTSTAEQTAGLAAQERDLAAAGAEKVFAEQVSSVAARDLLAECLAFLRAGDALVVTKPDRLARSTAELLTIEADLSKRGIGLVVPSMGGERLDTRNPTSKLMLTILAGVATWEREIMLERQREGIAKAKAEGAYKGRKPTARAKSAEIKHLHAEGFGPVVIAKRLGISRISVWRVLSGKGEASTPVTTAHSVPRAEARHNDLPPDGRTPEKHAALKILADKQAARGNARIAMMCKLDADHHADQGLPRSGAPKTVTPTRTAIEAKRLQGP